MWWRDEDLRVTVGRRAELLELTQQIRDRATADGRQRDDLLKSGLSVLDWGAMNVTPQPRNKTDLLTPPLQLAPPPAHSRPRSLPGARPHRSTVLAPPLKICVEVDGGDHLRCWAPRQTSRHGQRL